ncbi:hypothetical protein Tco_0400267 [Tanacetum coccineum]
MVRLKPSQSLPSNKAPLIITEKKRIRKKRTTRKISNVDPPTPFDPSVTFITEKFLKFNSFFESLGLVPPLSNTELICTKEEDGDVMFIEIIPKDDNSRKEEPKAGGYQVKGYNEGIVHSYEKGLETIWGKAVNRVHVLDFAGLTDSMRQTLGDMLSMVYTGDDRQAFFTSHAWRRLFEVRGPLVKEFMLEFFSTCRMSDTEMGLNVADTLWPAPSYVFIRDPVRRLCHRMIAYIIFGKGQAPEKYLFRHAEGRKSGARLSGGHFIWRLVAHFGLVSDQGLRGLSVVASELPLIDLHELERLNISAEDSPATGEDAQALPAPVQAPQPPPPASQHRTIGRTYQAFDSTLVSSSRVSYQRRVRPRIGDASTSTAPHTNDQHDP